MDPYHYCLDGHVQPEIDGMASITRTWHEGDPITLIVLYPTGHTRLSWESGRIADEEGYHARGVTIEESADDWLETVTSDGRDCDGRLTHTYIGISQGGEPIAPSLVSHGERISERQYIVMTGAKNIMGDYNRLIFAIPPGAKRGINKVEIIWWESSDLYEVNFYRITARGRECKLLMAYTHVYADQLRDVFTRETGLYTSL